MNAMFSSCAGSDARRPRLEWQVMRTFVLLGYGVLAACAEQGVRPVETIVVVDSADQVMYGMTTAVTTEGVRRSNVFADTAFVYQARNVYDLRNLSITFYDAEGVPTSTLTAATGNYDAGEAGVLDARGRVIWESADKSRSLLTEHLIYNKVTGQLEGDTVFTYRSETEVVTGNAFVSDGEFRNVTIQQPRAQQVPTPAGVR